MRARSPLFAFAVFAFVILAMLSPAGAAPGRKDPFASPQLILKWINGYRLAPKPERLPAAVKAMSRLALFRDLEAGAVYVGFMAGVLGDNPVTAPKLVTGMFPMPPEDQVAIIRAIAYSGLPDWKGLLAAFVERMPARKVLIERYLFGKAPTLLDLPIDEQPATLDLLWGYYFATGRMQPVARIVGILPWAREANDVDKLTAGSMAKWTLASNALQDQELLAHLKSEMNRQPDAARRELREVIEAAETFETARIRKAAHAAIEELRRKGPDKARQFAYWGQAGQTALALGCVVAGALGHPEVGLPCIISGAASTAALKLLAPR